MPFVTSFERYARQEGRQEGLRTGLQTGQIETLKEAIRDVLLTRFAQVPEELAVRLETCNDVDQLRLWLRQTVVAPDLVTVSAEML